jgi:archaellin
MKSKRGVSGVIAVVFIILITIAAVGVLAAVLIPFTKNNLNEGSKCLEVTPEISLVSSKTCYDSINLTKVTVGLGNVDVDGIYIVVDGSSGSVSCDIIGTTCANVFNSTGGDILEIPTKGGGQKTYLVWNNYTHVSVGGISNNKQCGISEEFDLKKCV